MTTSRTRTETVRERTGRLLLARLRDPALRHEVLEALRGGDRVLAEADAAEADALLRDVEDLLAPYAGPYGAAKGPEGPGAAERRAAAYVTQLWWHLTGEKPDSDMAADLDDSVTDLFDELDEAANRPEVDP